MEQISSITTEKSAYKVTFRKIARAAAAEARVHRKSAIIAYVLYGVAMLLFAINGHFYSNEFHPSGWGAVFAILGALSSFFATLNVFRDTNNQQLCDVAMALPIKATERFFSKLLCLFYIQTAPLIVSVLGGNMLCVMIGSINGARPDSDSFELIFAIFFALFAGSMFIMSITTLSACCCGAPAESAYFSVILGFIINFLPLFFVNNVLNYSAGFYTGSSSWLFDGWDNIDVTYWGYLYMLHDDNGVIMAHAAISSVISLIVMLLSIFIYKKRDARTVGTPIASKVFFELIMAGSCVTIFSIAVMKEGVKWGVLLAGVAYVIINVIVSRAKINGFSFLKWIGKFALTAAVFTGITAAMITTGGFGYYKTRPDAKYFDQARFTITVGNTYGYYNTELFTNELTPEQADELLKICGRHIQKGVSHVNPFSIMIDDTQNTSRVNIKADGSLEYWSKPSPSFQFEKSYRGRYVYSLDYRQSINIAYSDAQALLRELKQLDFIYDQNSIPSR